MITVQWECWNCEHVNQIIDNCTWTVKPRGQVKWGATCKQCGKKHDVLLAQDDRILEPLDGEDE